MFHCFLLILLLTKLATSFNPSSVNFCKLPCNSDENIACKCDLKGRRKEDLSNLTFFRKVMLRKHNDIRSSIASGREKFPYVGESSNMNVLSYDLELEYVARCYAVKYVFQYDRCRRTSRFQWPGQLVWRFTEKVSVEEIAKHIDVVFNAQMHFIHETTVDRYGGNKIADVYIGGNSYYINDFAQMLWWSHTRIGCARAYNPDAIMKHDTYYVICNYGGKRKSTVVGQPIYKKGTGCTECPDGSKCNKYYVTLCGNLEAVPNDTAPSIGGMNGAKSGRGWALGVWFCLTVIKLSEYINN